MSKLSFILHCEPDVGVFLFHWGANIHWGSLTRQITSSWFDFLQAPPSSTTFLDREKKSPQKVKLLYKK